MTFTLLEKLGIGAMSILFLVVVFAVHAFRTRHRIRVESLPEALGTLVYFYVNKDGILSYARHEPVRIQVAGTEKVFLISNKMDYDDAIAWLQVEIAECRKRIAEGKQ